MKWKKIYVELVRRLRLIFLCNVYLHLYKTWGVSIVVFSRFCIIFLPRLHVYRAFCMVSPGSATWNGLLGAQTFLPISVNKCHRFFFFFLYLQLEKGAKLCKSNKWGDYPVHQAAFSGAKKCMELILKYGELMFFIFSIVKKPLYPSSKKG